MHCFVFLYQVKLFILAGYTSKCFCCRCLFMFTVLVFFALDHLDVFFLAVWLRCTQWVQGGQGQAV